MIEGTDENFATRYAKLCKQRRVRPLPLIRVTQPNSLILTTDRVKTDDWGPILNSLSLDRSLKSVSVRSRYRSRKPLEEINAEKSRNVGSKGKEQQQKKQQQQPVVLTLYLLEWLSHSVASCLRNSRALTSLELEGLALPGDCLQVLCAGLAATASLRHLSLRRSWIGDSGCELVCRTVAELRSLRSLDLTECHLGEKCAAALAGALSRQKLLLYQETWKESLRYREPNVEAMPGLRRLTLNENPRLGDRAVSELIEAVRDSLWLKALDLRHCGLTDFIGRQIIHLLEHNTTLAVVDVRMNWNLSKEILREIIERLEPRSATADGTQVWASLGEKNVIPRKNGCVKAIRPKTATATIASATKQPKISIRLDLESAVRVPKTTDDPSRRFAANRDEERQLAKKKKKNILREFSEARHERERLHKEIKKTGVLLAEERRRRETAESTLRVINENLLILEATLATRGFLLISQRSFDDIATSFDRLLEILKRSTTTTTTITNTARGKDFVRKTKSESDGKRGLRLEGQQQSTSADNVAVAPSPTIQPIQPLERNIGDSPDVTYRDSNKISDRYSSPSCERARAIFARIVNGDSAIVDLVGAAHGS